MTLESRHVPGSDRGRIRRRVACRLGLGRVLRSRSASLRRMLMWRGKASEGGADEPREIGRRPVFEQPFVLGTGWAMAALGGCYFDESEGRVVAIASAGWARVWRSRSGRSRVWPVGHRRRGVQGAGDAPVVRHSHQGRRCHVELHDRGYRGGQRVSVLRTRRGPAGPHGGHGDRRRRRLVARLGALNRRSTRCPRAKGVRRAPGRGRRADVVPGLLCRLG